MRRALLVLISLHGVSCAQSPGLAGAPSPAASSETTWTERPLERVRGTASMIGAKAEFAIGLPQGVGAPIGSEGATAWEGSAVAGRRFHVQISLDHCPGSESEAAALVSVGSDERVARGATSNGFRVVVEGPRRSYVLRTQREGGNCLVCEASLSSTAARPAADRGAAAWLDREICGSISS